MSIIIHVIYSTDHPCNNVSLALSLCGIYDKYLAISKTYSETLSYVFGFQWVGWALVIMYTCICMLQAERNASQHAYPSTCSFAIASFHLHSLIRMMENLFQPPHIVICLLMVPETCQRGCSLRARHVVLVVALRVATT